MNKKDLLKFCRFYKGEDEPPKSFNQDETAFWHYENAWIEMTLKATASEDNSESAFISEMLEDYINAGLRDFAMTDDTPVTLKALLFNRYQHWMSDNIDAFKKLYSETYYKK